MIGTGRKLRSLIFFSLYSLQAFYHSGSDFGSVLLIIINQDIRIPPSFGMLSSMSLR